MQNWQTKDFQKVLDYNSYECNRKKGDHIIYSKKGCNPIAITAKQLNACVAQRLIRDNRLMVPSKIAMKYVI